MSRRSASRYTQTITAIQIISSTREKKEKEDQRNPPGPNVMLSNPGVFIAWYVPEKIPSGASSKGVIFKARNIMIITNRISPSVFPGDVAILILLIH
jgi:hypothetical protein